MISAADIYRLDGRRLAAAARVMHALTIIRAAEEVTAGLMDELDTANGAYQRAMDARVAAAEEMIT